MFPFYVYATISIVMQKACATQSTHMPSAFNAASRFLHSNLEAASEVGYDRLDGTTNQTPIKPSPFV